MIPPERNRVWWDKQCENSSKESSIALKNFKNNWTTHYIRYKSRGESKADNKRSEKIKLRECTETMNRDTPYNIKNMENCK